MRPIDLACAAILFDLDGTLVDSTAVVVGTWESWARRHRIELSAILAISHGRRTEETMRLLLPDLPDPAAEAAALNREEEVDTAGLRVIAGAQSLLASLPASRWAIVTSCPRRLAEIRLAAVGLPVPAVLITAESVAAGKPDPSGYLQAAQRLGWPAEHCLVVEDAPAGIAAGRNAAMNVLGITTTFPSEYLSGTIANVPDLAGVTLLQSAPMLIRIS